MENFPPSTIANPVLTESKEDQLKMFRHMLDVAVEYATKSHDPHEYVSFGDAVSWLRRAHHVANEMNDSAALQKVAEHYVDFFMRAATESQTWVLQCGNLLRRHRDLTIAMEACASHLVDIRHQQLEKGESMPIAFSAMEGYARKAHQIVEKHLRGEVVYTEVSELDAFMDNVWWCLKLGQPLSERAANYYRSDKETVELVGTAISNADCSLFRVLSFLSDWEKAGIYCKWAATVFADTSVVDHDAKACVITAAKDARVYIVRRDIRQGKRELKKALVQLRSLTSE